MTDEFSFISHLFILVSISNDSVASFLFWVPLQDRMADAIAQINQHTDRKPN